MSDKPVQPVLANEALVTVPVAYAFMGMTVVIFASAFAGIRYMLNDVAVMPFTGLRLTIAVAALAGIGAILGIKRPRREDMPKIVVSGLAGFSLYHLSLNYGAALVTAGQASLLVSTIPLWTAFAAWRMLGEVIEPRHWAGLAVSLVGVAVMSLEPGDLQIPVGALFVLAAAVFAALNIVMQKSLLSRYRPFDLTVMGAGFGSLPFILWIPSQGEALMALTPTHWAVVTYLALIPIGLGYWISTVALSALPAYRTSQFLLLIPPVASLIAWLFLDEVPSSRMLIGGAVVLTGVAATLKRKRRRIPGPVA